MLEMTSKTPTGTSPGHLLHAAIENNNYPECQRLLNEYGAKASTVKNRNGSTPLMLAANGKCGRENYRLVEALLADGIGGRETAAEKNKKGKTAADIAFSRNATALGNRLRTLEAEAAARESFRRCIVCRAKLRRRSKLDFLSDKASRGELDNPLLLEFFDDDDAAKSLARSEFHRINSCVSFRKELTESMSLISGLKQLRNSRSTSTDVGKEPVAVHGEISGQKPISWGNWHIIDLCCGNSLTAAVALHLLPDVNITAIDMVDKKNQPHFEAAGFKEPRFAYLQSDIVNDEENLVDALRLRSSEIISRGEDERADEDDDGTAITTVVFGMHCCGQLSLQAIKIFQRIRGDIIFLMPCCLPKKSLSDETTIKSVFVTNDQHEQYLRWANLLQKNLNEYDKEKPASCCDGQGIETDLKKIVDVLSPRNTLITGIRRFTKIS